MKIYIGSDHAGYELKEKLKTYIQSLNIEIIDKVLYRKAGGIKRFKAVLKYYWSYIRVQVRSFIVLILEKFHLKIFLKNLLRGGASKY